MKLSFLPYLLIVALLSSCIELEISAPSFIDIMNQFQVSESVVGLTITYNLLAFAIASVPYGPLSECYGRRFVMLIGNATLVLGSIACVIAPSMEWLLMARFIQGFGAATSAVVVCVIIADVYDTHKAAQLYAFMNAVFTTLVAIAPLFGALINATVGWRGNYAVVAVISLFSWLFLFSFLKETKATKEKMQFKKIMGDYKHILSSPLFLSAAAVPSLLYGCYLASVMLAPFIYMKWFDAGMLMYSLHQAAIIASFAIVSIFSSRLTDFLAVRKTLLIALCLIIVGATGLILSSTALALSLAMSVFCSGFALLYPIIFTRSMEIFPGLRGTASSVIMSLRTFLCALVTGFASYWFQDEPIVLGAIIFSVAMLVLILTWSIIDELGIKNIAD